MRPSGATIAIPATGSQAATPRGLTTGTPVLKTLLASDLVDSTRLIERLGDERSATFATRHDRLARDLLERYDGLEIDKSDGFLLLFDRPVDAVGFALAYHQGLRTLSEVPGWQVSARVGVHVGEVYLRQNPAHDVTRGAKPLEVEGLAKPVAARLMSLARGHQTLLTRPAFDLARRASAGAYSEQTLSWLAHGLYRFKGVEEPLAVFEVGSAGSAPLVAPEGSEKVRPVNGEEILGWRPAEGLAIPRRRHWILESKLGEGGVGEVWLALHEKTRACRVFKFCFDATRLRGLQREITLFRLLKETLGERKDISRILDWNFDEAPYFLESEYTEAGSAIAWAEAEGGLSHVPLAQRLEIAAQVAEALAAAHSVGVLHKDVKPANILIHRDPAGEPQAQLTDFGIGLVTDQKRLAEAGITLLGMTEISEGGKTGTSSGTPLYMAPEVLAGQPPTIEADVYSLGVVLYQLVIGDFTRPLAPGWERHVDDELLRQDIAGAVDGSPRRRVDNAQRLADRLRNLEPRRQRRQAERLEREAAARATAALEKSRRRRRLTLAVAVVASTFAAAMGVQSHRVAREAERANREAETSRRVSEFLIDLFEVSDPGEARGSSITARELLDRGAERIADELGHEPLIQARMMDAIGRVYGELGLYDQAASLLEDALETRREGLGEEHLEVAESANHLADLYWEKGDYAAAEPLLLTSLAIRERALGGQHPDVAQSLDNLGSLYETQGRYSSAEELHRRALAIRQRALGSRHPDVAKSLDDLAVLYLDQGRLAEAEPLSREALAIREELLGADHPDVAVALNGLAITVSQLERPEEAERLFRRALAIREHVLGPDHPALAQVLGNLANLLADRGRLDEAESHYRRAMAIQEKALGPDHASVGYNKYNLALLYADRGDDGAAARLYQQALAIWEEALGPEHPNVGATLRNLANLHRDQGRYDEAEPLYLRAVAILEGALGADHEQVEETLEGYAALLGSLGRDAEAAAIRARLSPTEDGAGGSRS